MSSIFVAADDSPTRLKSRADYVCTPTNAQDGINSAITLAATAGETVELFPGTYHISSSVVLQNGVSLVLAQKAVIKADADINCVTIAKNSKFSGGVIDLSSLATQTKAGIYFDCAQHYDFTDLTAVSDVYIKGNATGSYTGYGIHFLADASGEYACSVSTKNVRIMYMGTGIRIEALNTAGTTFINGNYFSDIWIAYSVTGIDIISGGWNTLYQAEANYFLNTTVQSDSHTLRGIKCQGYRNAFVNFDVWDWASRDAGGDGYIFEFPIANGFQNWIVGPFERNAGLGIEIITDSSSRGNIIESPQIQYGNEGGPTGSRPSTKYDKEQYYDTTLNKPIWWNGTNWVDATGTTA